MGKQKPGWKITIQGESLIYEFAGNEEELDKSLEFISRTYPELDNENIKMERIELKIWGRKPTNQNENAQSENNPASETGQSDEASAEHTELSSSSDQS